MPNRMFSSPEYRYGFNGKEKDESGEWGDHTNYDYGFRIYNPGVGRFLSVDPLFKGYPWYTPYQFAGNKPIMAVDLDGLEKRGMVTWFDPGIQNLQKKEVSSAQIREHYQKPLAVGGVVVTVPIIVFVGWEVGGAAIVSYAFVNPVVVMESAYAVGGFTVGIFDEGNQLQIPANPFDDVGRGIRLAFGKIMSKKPWFGLFQKAKFKTSFTIRDSKFDFFLGRLSSNNKALSDLTDLEIVNLAKSNVRSRILSKLGIDNEEALSKVIVDAFDNGKIIDEFDNVVKGEKVGRTIKKQIELGGENINVSFITRTGESVPEVSTLTIDGSNKKIKAEINRLFEEKNKSKRN